MVTAPVVCVVLAAGASTRFGSQKLLAALPGGDRLIERALRAVARYAHCVVASPEIAAYLAGRTADVVVNERSDLGMAHSLQLANAHVQRSAGLLVLPADLALIEPEHAALVISAAGDFDVTYPQRSDGTPGHPVVFSDNVRPYVAALKPNEPISAVRDRPELTRCVIPIDDPWPYRDVDRESDLASLAAEYPSGRFERQ